MGGGGPGGRGTGHLVVPENPTCPIRLRRRRPQLPILATPFSALAAEIRELGGGGGGGGVGAALMEERLGCA